MLQQDSTSTIQTILLTNTNLDIIFNQVKNTILLDNHHISKQKGLTERQQYYRDYGFSSGQSHQRKTDGMIENGILKPSLSNNIDKEVVNVFKVVNAIIDQECPWIWPGISAERSLEFAQSIHHDNKRIEAARFAVYPFDSTEIMKTQSALCKFHVDKKNGKDSKLSQVLIFSKMIFPFASSTLSALGWSTIFGCTSKILKTLSVAARPSCNCAFKFTNFFTGSYASSKAVTNEKKVPVDRVPSITCQPP